VKKAKAEDPSINAEIEVYMNEPLHTPIELSPKAEIVQVLKATTKHVIGRTPKTIGHAWSTEAPYYQALGIPAVGFGPGKLNLGNVDEHITIENVMNLAKIFTATILKVCA